MPVPHSILATQIRRVFHRALYESTRLRSCEVPTKLPGVDLLQSWDATLQSPLRAVLSQGGRAMT